MKRLITLVTLMALAAFTGCQSDSPNGESTPTAPPSWQTELYLPDAPIVAAEGTTVTIPITAQVTDKQGVPAKGVAVAFRLLSGEGDFDHYSVTSDAQGLVATNLLTTVKKGSQTLSISASTSGGSAKGDVTVKGTGTPARIEVMLPVMPVETPTDAPISLSLKAIVTDDAGSGLEGIPVSCHLENGEHDIFGSLTGGNLTGADGSVSLTFTSQGKFGKEYVVLATDTSLWQGPLVAGQDTLEVRKITNHINSLTIAANPNVIDPNGHPDSLYYSDIRAVVRDVDNVGIPNIVVDFETNIGTLSGITPTDGEGVAKARFGSNHEVGLATITASIPGTQYEATTTVSLYYRDIEGSLHLSSDVSFIYADNGITLANLKAVLKDQDDMGMVGKAIAFTANFGAITASGITDSLGIATAVFTDLGMPSLDNQGNVIPVWVKAIYRPLDLIDSVGVTIRPRNPVDHITLTAGESQIEASSSDSISLLATCFLSNGDFASEGTIVRFESWSFRGRFTKDEVPVGQFGRAESWFLVNQSAGPAQLHARVSNGGDNADSVVYSNVVTINILPGPPSGIRLIASPTQLRTNDPAGFSTIWAIVSDTAGNFVQGSVVHFTSTRGTIFPNAMTDTLGRAVTRLVAGVEAGIAEITGTVTTPTGPLSGVCTVTFIAGFPNTIELTVNPLQIAVSGTGENSTSTIIATVKDANGNEIETATPVVFQILNNPRPPLGCDLNNHGDTDSARTANGVALASVNAGEQIGDVLVRAYTWRDPDSASAGPDGQVRTDTVSATCRVAVVGGSPWAVQIDLDSRGEDAQGGTWKIPVSARVYDANQNPVADRIPVVFSVHPDGIATIDPGYTGNDIGGGVTHGIAYGYLYYNSSNTFDPITITADVQTPTDVIHGERPWILPLQRGQISLVADPATFSFTNGNGQRMGQADTCTIRVWATVTDGHGILINGAPVLFSTDRGHFYWKNMRLGGRFTSFSPDPVRRFSGLVDQENNEQDGVGTVYLRGWMNDFFLDDFALETTVHLGAQVEGYEDVVAQPATVTMTRR